MWHSYIARKNGIHLIKVENLDVGMVIENIFFYGKMMDRR